MQPVCLSKRLQDWPFKVYMRWQDRTCQVTAEQQDRCVVEVGPPTLAETESVWWVGYHCCSQCCCLHLNTERKFFSAYPRLLETGDTNLLGLGSFPALLWQPGALPPSPGTPVSLSKMRKLLLTILLSSRRCEVKPRLFRHLT